MYARPCFPQSGDGHGCHTPTLDLSAASDTVDHELLLETVERDVGLGGRCLDWLRGYLSDSLQSDGVGDGRSTSRRLVCGVSSGSVLPPPPFTIYTSSLGKLLRSLALQFYLFVDDTQLYLKSVLSRDASTHAISSVESGVLRIRAWTRSHMFVLNDSKTELVVFRPKSANSTLVPQTLTVGEATIHCSESARDLGALFDQHMTTDEQINSVCRAAHFHLRAILVGSGHSLIMRQPNNLCMHWSFSRLDCYNCFLYGLPAERLHKLQKVQNACAALICRTRSRDHVTLSC